MTSRIDSVKDFLGFGPKDQAEKKELDGLRSDERNAERILITDGDVTVFDHNIMKSIFKRYPVDRLASMQTQQLNAVRGGEKESEMKKLRLRISITQKIKEYGPAFEKKMKIQPPYAGGRRKSKKKKSTKKKRRTNKYY
jgi:hypothetical protein